MAGEGGKPPIRIVAEYDPQQIRAILLGAREFDRTLYLNVRRRIRTIVQPAVDRMKSNLTSGGYRTDVGMRAGIAAGTKVSIRTGLRSAGVSVRTSSNAMRPGKAPMTKAWNKRSFRHPAGRNHDTYVNQSGRPYFGATLNPLRGPLEIAVNEALSETAATLKG